MKRRQAPEVLESVAGGRQSVLELLDDGVGGEGHDARSPEGPQI